jgi:hypothetical protein
VTTSAAVQSGGDGNERGGGAVPFSRLAGTPKVRGFYRRIGKATHECDRQSFIRSEGTPMGGVGRILVSKLC